MKRVQQGVDEVGELDDVGTQTEAYDAAQEVTFDWQSRWWEVAEMAKVSHLAEVVVQCCRSGEVYNSLLKWRRRAKKASLKKHRKGKKKGNKVVADMAAELGVEDWEERLKAAEWESQQWWEGVWQQ